MPLSIGRSWRALTVGAVLLSACASLTSHAQGPAWKPLFDGNSTAAWHGYQKAGMPAGWSVVDGTLSKSTPV